MCISGWSDSQFEKQFTQAKETTNSSWDSMTNENMGKNRNPGKHLQNLQIIYLTFHIVKYLLDKPPHES